MANLQTYDKLNQLPNQLPGLDNEFNWTHLSKYQPKKPLAMDFKVLVRLTEYRDYKFSNGFYYLEKEELQALVKKMPINEFEILLDQLFGANPELYVLFKKILMNDSTDENYVSYINQLETIGVMNYNWSRYYCS